MLAVHQDAPVRLNLGAGNKQIEGWTSVDLAGEPDVVADIRELPFADGYADEVMAIHVLEHLFRWDVGSALKEWRRVLKPGGLLILELPDLVKCCRAVLAGERDRLTVWGLYGDPGYKDPLMVHKWGWTQEELTTELRGAGFTKVKLRDVQFHKPARDMRLEARA